jgi:hypothetical protein
MGQPGMSLPDTARVLVAGGKGVLAMDVPWPAMPRYARKLDWFRWWNRKF